MTNEMVGTTVEDAEEVLMSQVNLYEAKTHLSALVERASHGEEIIIAKAGLPRARLVPLETPTPERRPGRGRGGIEIGEDFDAPLPDDIAAAFGLADDDPEDP